jgi:hypothetical protein
VFAVSTSGVGLRSGGSEGVSLLKPDSRPALIGANDFSNSARRSWSVMKPALRNSSWMVVGVTGMFDATAEIDETMPLRFRF